MKKKMRPKKKILLKLSCRYSMIVIVQFQFVWPKNWDLGGKFIMDNKTLKGIALILFGILLSTGGAEINSII